MPRSLFSQATILGYLLVLTFTGTWAVKDGATAEPAQENKSTAPDAAGDPLPEGAVERFGSPHFRHSGPVSALAFLPTGDRLATGSLDGSVRIWDLATRREVRTLSTPGEVRSLALSRDGTHLLAGHWNGYSLWRVDSADEVMRGGVTGPVTVCLSPSNEWVAVGDKSGNVLVWEVRRRKLDQAHLKPNPKNLPSRAPFDLAKDTFVDTTGHEKAVRFIAFSPDGKTLLSVGDDGSLQRREAGRHGAFAAAVPFPASGSFAQSPDGKRLALLQAEGKLTFLDLSGKELFRTMLGQKESSAPSFTADGKSLLTVGADRVVLTEVATGKERFSFTCPGVTAATLSPDGRVIATGDQLGLIRTWDALSGQELGDLSLVRAPLTPVRISSDGQRVVTLSPDQTVRVFQRGKTSPIRTFRPTDAVSPLVFFPDGRRVAYGNKKNAVIVWDLLAEQQEREWRAHAQPVRHLVLSSDGRRLVTDSTDRTACLWDAATGELLQTFRHPDGIHAVVVSGDGKVICTATTDGKVATTRSVVRLWDGTTGKLIRSLDFDRSSVPGIQVSEDGTYCEATGDAYTSVWEVATGKGFGTGYGEHVRFAPVGGAALLIDTYWKQTDGREKLDGGMPRRLLDGLPTSSAFSADGRTVVLGLDDGSLGLWAVNGFKELRRLKGHRGGVSSAIFSADGRFLASGSTDGTVLLWDLKP